MKSELLLIKDLLRDMWHVHYDKLKGSARDGIRYYSTNPQLLLQCNYKQSIIRTYTHSSLLWYIYSVDIEGS